MTRIPAGHAVRSSSPVSSATSAPSRASPWASSAGVHARAGSRSVASWIAGPLWVGNPIEYSTVRPRTEPSSLSQSSSRCVAPAVSARTRIRRLRSGLLHPNQRGRGDFVQAAPYRRRRRYWTHQRLLMAKRVNVSDRLSARSEHVAAMPYLAAISASRAGLRAAMAAISTSERLARFVRYMSSTQSLVPIMPSRIRLAMSLPGLWLGQFTYPNGKSNRRPSCRNTIHSHRSQRTAPTTVDAPQWTPEETWQHVRACRSGASGLDPHPEEVSGIAPANQRPGQRMPCRPIRFTGRSRSGALVLVEYRGSSRNQLRDLSAEPFELRRIIAGQALKTPPCP